MRFVAELRLFVLHIGENLIQITGMHGMHIILSLRGVCIVLGINDEDLIASGQHNIALHDRKHGANSIVQRPRNLRCRCRYLWTFLGVILQYKFLIQAVHTLLVNEGSQSVFAGVRGQQHSFEDQLAQTNEHTIGITLLRSRTKDKIILKSEPESIITFNFTFLLGENRHTVNYKVQFEKAKNIEEIADSFSLATALLAHLYRQEDNTPAEAGKVSLSDVKEYFRCYESFFKRLRAIESMLALSISPSLLNDLPREEQQDIDELYLLLCEKKVVRLNAKLTSTNLTSVAMNHTDTPLSIGGKIALTFLSTIEFNFLKQTVTLHTANLLVNALVKDIQECDDGTVKILYGDTDSKPMYISFSAFKTKEEAEQEGDNILQHDEVYINALTSNAYINQFYSERK